MEKMSKAMVQMVENEIKGIVEGYNRFPQSLVEEDKDIPMPEISRVSDINNLEYRNGILKINNPNIDKKEISPNFLASQYASTIRRDLQDICSGKSDCKEYKWSDVYEVNVEPNEDHSNVTVGFYFTHI